MHRQVGNFMWLFVGCLLLDPAIHKDFFAVGLSNGKNCFCINILARQVHKKMVLAKAQDMVKFIFFQYGHLL